MPASIESLTTRRILAALSLLTVAAAPSFDCKKASTPVDRAICADDHLAAQDRALVEYYDEVHRTLTPEGVAVLLASQRRWLESRTPCAAKDHSHLQAVACLSSLYTDRVDELNAQYQSADGLSIENREVSRTLPKLRTTDFTSYPLLIGPKARVDGFNRYVAKRFGLDKPLSPPPGIEQTSRPPGSTTSAITMRFTASTPG